MAVWLTTLTGERYELVMRDEDDESTAITRLIDGVGSPANKGWAIGQRHGRIAYVNLRNVERIERGEDSGEPLIARR